MARKPPKLTVNYSLLARRHLAEIWQWNFENHGEQHADEYISFLRRSTARLSTEYHQGKQVPSRSDYRYVLLKKRTGGNGHVAVYLVTSASVEVLAFYHTSQDWHRRIDQGEI